LEEFKVELWTYLERRKADQEKLEAESKTGLRRREGHGFGSECRRDKVLSGVSGSS
jgi:hypothetical protein